MQLSTTILSELPTLGHRVAMELTEDERRGAHRTLFFRKALVEWAAEGQADVLSVMVTDISDSGVGLLCSREVEKGKTFVLRLPRRSSSESFRIKCTVVRCQGGASGGQYSIGATFEQLLGGFGQSSISH